MSDMNKKLLLIFLLFSFASFSQNGKVVTSVDTIKNKIGAQFTLTIKATADSTASVLFPKSKQFGKLEVINSYPVDTVRKDALYELVKKYGLTQFDSGTYTIPRLPVVFNKKTLFSDSIRVEVMNVKVDTLKQKLYDIKDIVKTNEAGKWWIWVLIILALGVLAYFGYKYYKKQQGKERIPETYKTPIEKATSLLQQLERKELVQKGEVKAYYSELTDIARNYIEEVIRIPAMESTTSELIEKLRLASVQKNIALNPETVTNLEKVLFQADLVKFAKEKPLEYEIADDRKRIESAIITIDHSVPVDSEQEASAQNELIRQQILKRRKKRQLYENIALGFVVGFSVVIALFATGLIDVFGPNTKKMLEGEWIYSEYGNPGVAAETPKVLTRLDANKILDPKAIAILKDFQIFGYGDMTDPICVMISTYKYKQATEIDLATIVEGSIKDLENKGAQNILVKQEEFTTKAGISGIRSFGTMSVIDENKKKSSKRYYEMLYFKQDEGLQQVFVSHEEGDKYGEGILERIIASTELKIGAQ